MKITYQSGPVAIEATGETVKDVFKQLATAQEVFCADQECGCCKSKNLRFQSRQVDDFEFYEIACIDCHARMAFGQAKKGGGLFPKRKDEDGNWLDNRGWSVYRKPEDKPSVGASKVERKNGVAVFASWEAAEGSTAWTEPWIVIGKKLHKFTGENYRYVKEIE